MAVRQQRAHVLYTLRLMLSNYLQLATYVILPLAEEEITNNVTITNSSFI